MGYYTRYEAKTVGLPGMAYDVAALAKGLDAEGMIADFLGESPFEDRCKWYDHDSNMKTFSLQFPDTVFALSGVGEESPDLWVKYYKAGKVQAVRATISYAPYDESKLSDSDKMPPRG